MEHPQGLQKRGQNSKEQHNFLLLKEQKLEPKLEFALQLVIKQPKLLQELEHKFKIKLNVF